MCNTGRTPRVSGRNMKRMPLRHLQQSRLGETKMKTLESVAAKYRTACIKAACFAEKNATALLLLFGVVLLTGGLTGLSLAQTADGTNSFSEADFDDSLIRMSVGNLFRLIEGAFGALIMVVAGLGAIVA